MTLDTPITLIKMKSRYGNTAPQIESEFDAWGAVSFVGKKTYYQAKAAGAKLEAKVTVWKDEYDNHTHLQHDNETYKIDSVTPNYNNDLYVDLLITKG